MPWVETLQQSTVLLLFLAALLGLVVGSFLNVVIYRLPNILDYGWAQQCRELLNLPAEESEREKPPGLISPRSRCQHCGHQIDGFNNIPLVSFLLLRGRCAQCHTRISWRYPAIEALSAALSIAVVWHFGMTTAGGLALVLTWGLIALSFIDADHQILPDVITLPGLWLGLIANIFDVFTDLQSAVIGAVAGYVSLWLVYHTFKLATGKEGMGFGDFKLLGLFGAWMGWQLLPLIILLSALAGAIIGISMIVIGGRDRGVPIPFGPFLAIAGWVALLWGDEITRGYLRFAGLI